MLDVVLDAEFRGDGPLGFVLTKEQWLDRYRQGELLNEAFAWSDPGIRIHGDTAVATGIQSQAATYRGRDCSGRFRGTVVAVRGHGGWRIVNLQLGALDGSST